MLPSLNPSLKSSKGESSPEESLSTGEVSLGDVGRDSLCCEDEPYTDKRMFQTQCSIIVHKFLEGNKSSGESKVTSTLITRQNNKMLN